MTNKNPALAADSAVVDNRIKSDADHDMPCCGTCRSQDVVRDAWAAWNAAAQEWVIDNVFDDAFCKACEETIKIEWKRPATSKTDQIRVLNDALRTGASNDGLVVITSSIQSFGPDFIITARQAVAAFADFNPDNDPHGEHDFGSLEVQGEKLFFKVDYYDLTMKTHSTDAADPAVTKRVMTIMLASEY